MLDQGTRWKCNLCFVPNDFPPNFDFDPITNSYVDRNQKIELKCPIYEFIAPVEYMVRPPQPPAYLFVIDVSWSAVSSGTPVLLIYRILGCVQSSHFGFLGFVA